MRFSIFRKKRKNTPESKIPGDSVRDSGVSLFPCSANTSTHTAPESSEVDDPSSLPSIDPPGLDSVDSGSLKNAFQTPLAPEPEQTWFIENKEEDQKLSIITTERLRQLLTDFTIPVEVRSFISDFIKQRGSYYIRNDEPNNLEAPISDGTEKIVTSAVPMNIKRLVTPRYQPHISRWLDEQAIAKTSKTAVGCSTARAPRLSAFIPRPPPVTDDSKQDPEPSQFCEEEAVDPGSLGIAEPLGTIDQEMDRKLGVNDLIAREPKQLAKDLETLPASQLPNLLHSNLSRSHIPYCQHDLRLQKAYSYQSSILSSVPSSLPSLSSSCSTVSSESEHQLDLSLLADFAIDSDKSNSYLTVKSVPRFSRRITRRSLRKTQSAIHPTHTPSFELKNPNTYCGSSAMSGPYPCIPNRQSLSADGKLKRLSSAFVPLAFVDE